MQDNSQRILTLTKNKELPFKDARPLEIDERGRRNGWRGFSKTQEGKGGEAKGCFAASKEETGGIERERERKWCQKRMEKKGEEEDKDGRSDREKGINADERTDGETSVVQKCLPFLQNWNGVSYFHCF